VGCNCGFKIATEKLRMIVESKINKEFSQENY